MAYDFYIGTMLLPISPEKLTIKIKNNNKTYNMINTGEINALKTPGLTEIDFDALLPNTRYPFAIYKDDGFKGANYYLEELERLKTGKKTFQFIVSRVLPGGDILFDTNMTCALEDYSIKEDASSYGTDVLVSVSLKQYRDYSVKRCKIKTKKKISLSKFRKSKIVNIPSDKKGGMVIAKGMATFKVKKTTTLYRLAKEIYGKGELYTVLAKANDPKRKGSTEESTWTKSKVIKAKAHILVPLSYYS